jgi:hypothetical protein
MSVAPVAASASSMSAICCKIPMVLPEAAPSACGAVLITLMPMPSIPLMFVYPPIVMR